MMRNRMLYAWRNLPGMERCLAIAYQMLIVAPKDSLCFVLKGEPKLAKSRLARSEGFLEAVLSDSPPQITQISTERNHFLGDIHKRESEILWNSLRFYRIL